MFSQTPKAPLSFRDSVISKSPKKSNFEVKIGDFQGEWVADMVDAEDFHIKRVLGDSVAIVRDSMGDFAINALRISPEGQVLEKIAYPDYMINVEAPEAQAAMREQTEFKVNPVATQKLRQFLSNTYNLNNNAVTTLLQGLSGGLGLTEAHKAETAEGVPLGQFAMYFDTLKNRDLQEFVPDHKKPLAVTLDRARETIGIGAAASR